jgi:hypothetical protein
MTPEERRAKGRMRRLVFQNLANGVPREQIREDLRLSDLEIDQAREFVGRKITENRTLRRQPPIPCLTLAEIRFHRRELLGVLSVIGDIDLSTDLILSKLLVQSLDHPSMIAEARDRMEEVGVMQKTAK